jgi:glycosyltransferase involved in cell wall biosynthesis
MKASILIACANDRAELLKKSIESLDRQNTRHDVELIILNDGSTDNGIEEAAKTCKKYPVQYVYMNNKPGWWRTPTTCFNTGGKISKSEALILACPEMYSVNDTLDVLLDALDGQYMVIPRGMDDRDGAFLRENKCDTLHPLNTTLPFFMAIRHADWDAIGGYDEAMTGISFDDDDFVARMKDIGVTHKQTEARVVHLYHPRISDTIRNSPENRERWLYNKRIFDAKREKVNML